LGEKIWRNHCVFFLLYISLIWLNYWDFENFQNFVKHQKIEENNTFSLINVELEKMLENGSFKIMYMCHNQLFCSNNFILFYFIFVGRLLYKEFGKFFFGEIILFSSRKFH
jgi:hypothetical protein